jgi:riboflavin synthase alpha subunit
MLHSSCLSAGYRYQAALKEMDRVQHNETECDITEHGSVTINNISLTLKRSFLKVINLGEFIKL